MDKNIGKYVVLDKNIIKNFVMANETYASDQGWIKCEDDWKIGSMLEIVDGQWGIVIDHKKDILEKLAVLDNAISLRTIRQAALGDDTAINKIKEVEKKADELREKLQEL